MTWWEWALIGLGGVVVVGYVLWVAFIVAFLKEIFGL